jgi:predicted dehydrogenase
MGREAASSFARWIAVEGVPVRPELVAVADVDEQALNWFRQVPGVRLLTTDFQDVIANPEVQVVYAAVPHHLHEEVCAGVLAAGKDLLGEKPFGIDLGAAERIAAAGEGLFVRCASEFPYFPGAQAVIGEVRAGGLGRILEIVSGLHHSSDLDPQKPANWKRRSATCGEIGVMGDLGMHVLHVPLRLGWMPRCVYAQLQKGYPERPGGTCDTWDNATLHAWVEAGGDEAPMRLEMKRMAPGETNTWFIEVRGTDGGARFSTKEPKTFWRFRRGATQEWSRTDLGFGTPFKAITGGIFEPGFPDVLQQMWAAFLAERAGKLGDRFGCARPEEAVAAHRVFASALRSAKTGRSIDIET